MVFGLRTAINCGSGEIKKFIIRIITNRGSWLFRHDCNIMGIITLLKREITKGRTNKLKENKIIAIIEGCGCFYLVGFLTHKLVYL